MAGITKIHRKSVPSRGADIAKARGPIVKVCDLGTNNTPVDAERSCERPAIALTGVKKS